MSIVVVTFDRTCGNTDYGSINSALEFTQGETEVFNAAYPGCTVDGANQTYTWIGYQPVDGLRINLMAANSRAANQTGAVLIKRLTLYGIDPSPFPATTTPTFTPTATHTYTPTATPTATPTVDPKYQTLINRVRVEGSIEVIVTFSVNSQSQMSRLSSSNSVIDPAIDTARTQLLNSLTGYNATVLSETTWITPSVWLYVDETALLRLISMPEVTDIAENRAIEISEDTTYPIQQISQEIGPRAQLIGAQSLWPTIDGEGVTIAILDAGVDATHPFFGTRVVKELCIPTKDNDKEALCSKSGDDFIKAGTGAASPATCLTVVNSQTNLSAAEKQLELKRCTHGTGVAGIAKSAKIIGVQMFHYNKTDRKVETSSAQIMDAVNQVITLREEFKIAAINMSIGDNSNLSSSICDGSFDVFPNQVSAIRTQLDIPIIVASGNNEQIGKLGFPACLQNTLIVGATDDQDKQAAFSNFAEWAKDRTLFAPGVAIITSVTTPNLVPGIPINDDQTGLNGGTQPDGFYDIPQSGTSFAAPHLTGAWALIKQRCPNVGVDDAIGALQATGSTVTASNGSTLYSKRIQVNSAVNKLIADQKCS